MTDPTIECIDLTLTDDEDSSFGNVETPGPSLGGHDSVLADTHPVRVKLETGNADEADPSAGQKRRRNNPRKARPAEGSLNLQHLVKSGTIKKADMTRKQAKPSSSPKGRADDEDGKEEDSLGSMKDYGADVDVQPSAAVLQERAQQRESHKVRFLGSSWPSAKKEGWRQHDGVEFLIDDELPESLIRLSKDSMILAKLNTGNGLGVAQVLEVLEDPHGEAGMAVRYGWFPADIVDLSLLDFPLVTVKYPRQVFWQKDACEDGICHVSGSNEGKAWNDIVSWTHVGAPCEVKHRSQLTAEELQACQEKLPENEEAASLDPDKPELFFYSLQYDHTVKRFETVWLERDAHIKQPRRYVKGPLTMMDAFCGVGNCSKAAQLLSEASAQAAAAAQPAGVPAAPRAFDIKWGIEKEKDVFSVYVENISGEDCHLDLLHAVSIETFVEGTRHYHKTGELPKWGKPPERDGVGLLHCSPPCQGLSKLNTWTDEARVEEGLFPVLDQLMELVDLVRPTFMTLEEVTTFLLTSLRLDHKEKGGGTRQVRCIWRVLLPLLDMGYQVDVRILNAVHYAVPQLRKRLIIFVAKPDYQLPTPPTPWRHYDGDATAAEEPLDSSEEPPPPPTKRGRRGSFLVEACHDKALLNVRESRWASVVVGSAAAHAGPLGPLPPAVTAREAIDDLPEVVEAGQGMQTFQYDKRWIELQSPYVKFLRSEQERHLHSNWLPKAEKNTAHCLKQIDKRPDYDAPYPTIFGSISRHAAHHLCPRPGAERLCSVAEKKRVQCMLDSMRLTGPVHKHMTQVGNAVPLLMAWAIFGAVYSAAYGVNPPVPEFVRQRQIAAGKRPTCYEDGDVSMDTITDDAGEGDGGEPLGEGNQVSKMAGPSEAPATPAQLPQPMPRRPADPGASPKVMEEGNNAGAPGRVGTSGAADTAAGGRGDPGSPMAAAAEALRDLAAAQPVQARGDVDRPIRKRQRLVGNVFSDEVLPLNVLRAGKSTKAPGHHSGIRPTLDFYSPNERPVLPATPAKRPMKSNPSGTPLQKALRPCALRGLRELPCRKAAATSAASATGSALPASPATQLVHPEARGGAAAYVGDDLAAAKLCEPAPTAAGAAAARRTTRRRSESHSPSPAGMPRRRAFPFRLVSSRTASPALVDAAAPRPNGTGPAAALAKSSLGPHQPDEDVDAPGDVAQDVAGEAESDLSPRAEPDEEVDVVSLDMQSTAPLAREKLQMSPAVESGPPKAANVFQAAESEPKADLSHALAAFGSDGELAAGGSALVDQLANDMVRSAVAQGIGDLTSDDMRTFEDGAASSVVHASPDQAAPAAPDQAVCQACAVPDQTAPPAPEQAECQACPVPDHAALIAPEQAECQACAAPDQAAPAAANQAAFQGDVLPEHAASAASTAPTACVPASGIARGVPVAPQENTVAPAKTFQPPAWVEPGFMGGAQRAAAGWVAAAAVTEPKHPLSKNQVAANEPDQAPAQPHSMTAPDEAPCQLAQQQPPTEPASFQGDVLRGQPAMSARKNGESAVQSNALSKDVGSPWRMWRLS
ncbi:g3249 [Coccomyxa elongata]